MAGVCARQFCNAQAAARVDFDGEARIVWIDELDDLGRGRPPAACCLCRAHVDRFAPPRNWDLHDLRAAPEVPLVPEVPFVPEVPATAAATEPTSVVLGAPSAPAWSPHLFPDGNLGGVLDGVLDAKSPLLSRAFRGVRAL